MLFDIDELEGPAVGVAAKRRARAKSSAAKDIDDRKPDLLAARALSRAADVIGKLAPGVHRHFVSDGEWALHDTLAHVLANTGPADVWLATWSISPDGLARLLKIQEDGYLLSLSMMSDWRLKVRRPEAVQLAKGSGVRLRVGHCHAKAAVIRNDKWDLVIITSANLTNNPRTEVYVLLDNAAAADFHVAWIEHGMVTGAPFDDSVTLI